MATDEVDVRVFFIMKHICMYSSLESELTAETSSDAAMSDLFPS